MRIVLRLQWLKPGKPATHGFKSKALLELIQDYIGRSRRYCEFEWEGALTPGDKRLTSASNRLWFCHLGPKSKQLESEALAQQILSYQQDSVKEWHIAVGPATGWTQKDLSDYRPQVLWSLGLATYPHELVSLLVAEQIYRGLTIGAGHPYHRAGGLG
jgi:23S rRNA (pseudouridine1915-N3)-methyltransferase